MSEHQVGTREEWLAARQELLESEKELTRRSDELARRRMGWRFPWASCGATDFNLDYRGLHRRGAAKRDRLQLRLAARAHLDVRDEELHGLSAFALEDGVVHHTYSCYDRGTDVLNATWQLLDRTPKGPRPRRHDWPPRHDEYEGAGDGDPIVMPVASDEFPARRPS